MGIIFSKEVSGPKKGRFLVFGKVSTNLLRLLGLLGQKNSLDVGQNTTLGDGDA